MTFWQENYGFVKDVYDFRLQKYQEWMDNLEAIVSKVMAPNVQYTYKEFKIIQDSLSVSTRHLLSETQSSPVTLQYFFDSSLLVSFVHLSPTCSSPYLHLCFIVHYFFSVSLISLSSPSLVPGSSYRHLSVVSAPVLRHLSVTAR